MYLIESRDITEVKSTLLKGEYCVRWEPFRGFDLNGKYCTEMNKGGRACDDGKPIDDMPQIQFPTLRRAMNYMEYYYLTSDDAGARRILCPDGSYLILDRFGWEHCIA